MFASVPAPKENRNLLDAMNKGDLRGEISRIAEAKATDLGKDYHGVTIRNKASEPRGLLPSNSSLTGFLRLSSTDTWSQVILCCGLPR